MESYDFGAIEKKWMQRWEKEKVFEVSEKSDKKKYYVLDMFPYPSGAGLHMGHAFVYTLGDIYARFKRLQGFNVLYPIGYDALGLPAENAAIKDGTHPAKYTKKAIANFMAQQKAMGWSYDWSRMVNSTEPGFYKWDQWIFLKMLKKGLAYKKKAPVNWCGSCNTVLANEQAQGGVCERCGSKLEIKHLEQWFLKITDYADELLEKLEKLDWPERAKVMQKNWIGKSYGTQIDFEVEDEKWSIFTTRPDTIYGVTFMVISAQHEKLMDLVIDEQKAEVKKFLKKIKSVSEKVNSKNSHVSLQEKDVEDLEKEGAFTGSYAVNPLTKEKIPIYAGNFVVADYGSGMVMAVPAHDQRDFEFAKKYNIPIKVVIEPSEYSLNAKKMSRAYTGDGKLVNSEKFNGWSNREAIDEITKFLAEKKLGKKDIQYKLRDWLISRQRYWGTPIPIVYCDECGNNIKFDNYKSYLMGASKISDSDLQKVGVSIEEKTNDGDRKLLIPNDKIEEFLKLVEQKLDNGFWNEVIGNEIIFIFRFKDGKTKKFILNNKNSEEISKLCANFANEPFEKTSDLLGYLLDNDFYSDYVIKIRNKNCPAIVPVDEKDLPVILPEDVKFGKGNPLATNKEFVNVKCPSCGGNGRRETDTMDTFVNSSWYFLRYCDAHNDKDIFDKKKVKYWMPIDQYIGGSEHVCMHLLYFRFYTKFLRDIGLVKFDEPALKLFNQGMILGSDGEKMSKSKGNIIEPLEMLEKYGADSLRFYLVSVASPDKAFSWDDSAMNGTFKFVNRIFNYFENVKLGKSSKRAESKINQIVKDVGEYIENFKYNLAVIKIRKLFEAIENEKEISKLDAESFLKIFSVFCPYIGEELWEKMGNKEFISLADLPVVDESKIDEKLEEQERAVEKTMDDINHVINLVKEKQNKDVSKIYLYVIPNELESYNAGVLSKRFGKKVSVFAVNDSKRYDPEGKAFKAKLGKPGIFVE